MAEGITKMEYVMLTICIMLTIAVLIISIINIVEMQKVRQSIELLQAMQRLDFSQSMKYTAENTTPVPIGRSVTLTERQEYINEVKRTALAQGERDHA
jgi:septal ring-binding cell division protein DamX